MGNKPVIIKGTKDGITIILEENSNFEDVEKIIYEKLQSGRNFFAGGKVYLKSKKGFVSEEEYKKTTGNPDEFRNEFAGSGFSKDLNIPKT